MVDYNALMQSYTNKLAEQRLLLTQWATQVVTQYDGLPDDVKAELPPLPGHSAKEMVPALYDEPITSASEAAYKEQIEVLDRFVAACNAKLQAINDSEAVRCKLS